MGNLRWYLQLVRQYGQSPLSLHWKGSPRTRISRYVLPKKRLGRCAISSRPDGSRNFVESPYLHSASLNLFEEKRTRTFRRRLRGVGSPSAATDVLTTQSLQPLSELDGRHQINSGTPRQSCRDCSRKRCGTSAADETSSASAHAAIRYRTQGTSLPPNCPTQLVEARAAWRYRTARMV